MLKVLIQGNNLVAWPWMESIRLCQLLFVLHKGKQVTCWAWWNVVLKENGIGDNPNLLFISDRHAAIAMAVENEFPLAFHVSNMTYEITDWAAHKVAKTRMKSATWVVKGVNKYQYQVSDGQYIRAVNLQTGICECRKWQLSGLPCGHEITTSFGLVQDPIHWPCPITISDPPYSARNARLWFNDFPAKSIDSYDDLKKAFLENYLQQKKCIKDPIELHNIKLRDRESTEDFVRRYKLESRDVKGHQNAIGSPKSCMESQPLNSINESGHRQNFKKGGFQNQQRPKRKQDRFTLLTKTPKEISALEMGKFKTPPPMTTPIEKRNHAKFCEFHGEVRHTADECMHLKKQIEKMLRAGKLSHLIKEIKQNSGREQPKAKKGETFGKDKALTILMVQPWERVARQKITHSFSPNPEIFFPPLGEDEGIEGPIIIEAEIGGHYIHRMYVDGGSASEILYEHYFSRLHPEIKNQLVPATTPLIGFSSEIILPIGQIQLLVTIGDEEHSYNNPEFSSNAKSTYVTMITI
ncbi:reverse transcriptase domain-containing protein [Tanacetum coccineum]